MSVSKRSFSATSQGQEATLYTIKDKTGITLKVSDYGATVISVLVPDRDGVERDVLLGFDTLREYETDDHYIGACLGRCADRVKDGEIFVNGKRYLLEKNDGNNNRHSGPYTYNKRMWHMTEATSNSVTFELISPELDQGFPGELILQVRYSITDGNRFEIEFTGEADADTVMNFSNRLYFNLDGQGEGPVDKQYIWINAGTYAKLDKERIPTGELGDVKNTKYDFTARRILGSIENELIPEPLEGYSINYALEGGESSVAANMYSQKTGILMNVYTDLPCLKLLVPESLDVDGKDGKHYGKLPGTGLFSQHMPDAVHHPGFTSPIVRCGEVFKCRTIYEFRTVEEVE